jgi:adenylosuccinate lyase
VFIITASSQALMISGSRSQVIVPRINVIIAALSDLSSRHASQPMMAREYHLGPCITTALLSCFTIE